MAASEATTRVEVGLDDIPGALALSRASGWNQTEEDWAVFITRGRVLGARGPDGTLVATGAALPYGSAQGWISMVLVTPAWRKRGLATELLGEGVRHLRSSGLTPVLDATPAGEPVYRRLGFEPGMAFERWEADLGATAGPASSAIAQGLDTTAIRPTRSDELDHLCTLDAAASLIERRFLLESFLGRPDTRAWVLEDRTGFVIRRAGLRAAQIGPLVAPSEAAAIDLLRTALRDARGPVFLDVPSRWQAMTAWLQRHGFARQRPFTRMALGPSAALAGSERLFVLAGPEFG